SVEECSHCREAALRSQSFRSRSFVQHQMESLVETHATAAVAGSSLAGGTTAFPAGRFGWISRLLIALQISSADCTRILRTSVWSSGNVALAEEKSHLTARGKQAAILRLPQVLNRCRDGSLRADISHRSATASNATPDSQSFRKTASFTSL